MRTHAARVVHMTAGILPGPYRVPAYRAIGHFRLTNKTPAATYRAPGRYETTFVRERLVDAIAHQLGIDRIEVRRRNTISAAEMPYPRPLEALGEEIHYDTGDYIGLLDKLFAKIDWDALNAAVTKRKAAGELVGIGVAMFVEKSGLGPTDGVKISIDTSGMVEVVTGGASIGQGFETVMAQVAADALGVDYKNCRVIHGQTDRIAFGIGAHASRATVMTASATHVAALNVRKKALDMAAELLQTPPDALDIVDGDVVRKDGRPGPSISLGAIAKNLAPDREDARRPRAGTSAEGWFKTKHQVYPYGSHVAVVRVDRDTGGVTVERYCIAYDIGRAINPATGARPDRRRLRARSRRRAVRGVHLQRARRSARRHLRRLSAPRHARDAGAGSAAARGLHHSAQSARHQGRRRKRHHRRRRRHRFGHRGRHRHPRRGARTAGDAAADQGDAERQMSGK